MKNYPSHHHRPALLALTFATLGTCAVLAQGPEAPPAPADIEKSDPFRKDAGHPDANPAQPASVEILEAQAAVHFSRNEHKAAADLQATAVGKALAAASKAVDNFDHYIDYTTGQGLYLFHHNSGLPNLPYFMDPFSDGIYDFQLQTHLRYEERITQPWAFITTTQAFPAGNIAKLSEVCRAVGLNHITLRTRPPAGNMPLRDKPEKSEPLPKDAAKPAAKPPHNPAAGTLEAEAWALFARGDAPAAQDIQQQAMIKAQEAVYRAIENLALYRGDLSPEESRLYILVDGDSLAREENIRKEFGNNAGEVGTYLKSIPGLGRSYVILTLSKNYPSANIAPVIEACRAAGVTDLTLRTNPSAEKIPVRDESGTPDPARKDAANPDANPAQKPTAATHSGGAALDLALPAHRIIQKLETIIIPQINFENTALEEALDFLRLRSAELDELEGDPARKGLDFVVAEEGEVKEPSGSAVEGKAAPSPKNNWAKNRMIGQLRVRNVKLTAALEYICKATGTRFEVDDHAVIFFDNELINENIYTGLETLPESQEQVVTYVMKLEFLAPDEAERIFKSVVSQGPGGGSVVSVPNAKSVMISGKVPLVRKLVMLQREIDIRGDQPMDTDFFNVAHADTTELAVMLNQLVAPVQAGKSNTRADSDPSAGEDLKLRIVADPRTKRILIMGRPIDILFIKGLAAELDKPAKE